MSIGLNKAPATLADLLAIPEHERFHEIIGGELVRKVSSDARHGFAQARLTGRLGRLYDRRSGGRWPGGWAFVLGAEIGFTDNDIYRPDIAAWRRERLPVLTDEIPITVRPDWVCEILSPPNTYYDTILKMRIYLRSGVPHYWIVDPINEFIMVHRWTESGYLVVQSAQCDERLRAEPFDAVNLSVHGLLEGDEDDEE